MIPRLRTIAILMLLAGLSLGIFASRALRAMGGQRATGPVSGGNAYIEQQVTLHQRSRGLTDLQADAIRRELYAYDRRVEARLWELRQEHADWFEQQREATEQRIRTILADAAADAER